MGITIGIDLGTTNSCVSFIENGKVEIVPNSYGKRTTASVVAFNDKNEILVGEAALNQQITNPDNTIFGIKRLMGNKNPVIINNKKYLPENISSYILASMKNDVEKKMNEKITGAVITVPAYFSDSQRQATIEAGNQAGLNVLRIINEPTAAALAYGLNTKEEQTVLVYDLGGGTFDVSILDIADGVFEVRATNGNNKLGGMDFDRRLSDLIVKNFYDTTKIDLSEDKLAMKKILEVSENAKIELSENISTEINIPFITADVTGAKHINFELTRDIFEELITDFIDETIELTKDALFDADCSKEEVKKIILVGGSTKIPLVRKKIEDFAGLKVLEGINPDEVVSIGAGIQAGIIKGEIPDIVLVDVTPLSLGIEVDNGFFVPIIERNTPIPADAKRIFTTTKNNQDEVMIHILQGESKNAIDNISLGEFLLTGIRKASRGEPRIEVIFQVDVDSIVKVSAMDIDTKETQNIIINSK
jgi:molecular chaperone DnaK